MILCQDLRAWLDWVAAANTSGDDWQEGLAQPSISMAGDVRCRILPPVALGKGISAMAVSVQIVTFSLPS